MSHILVEPDLSERLKSQVEPAELVDAGGSLLGYFVPAHPASYPADWAPELDREGFEAALASAGGVSTAELLSRLERR